MSSEAPPFNISQRERQGRYTLILSGELDLQTSPQLTSAITRLCEAGALEIEIDLRDVSFIDSSGVRAILHAKEQCEGHRAEFFIVPGTHPGPRRLFEIMALTDKLPWREAASNGSPD
jgi:anti-anti-sigma factor